MKIYAPLMRQNRPILQHQDVTADGYFFSEKRFDNKYEARTWGRILAERVKGFEFVRAVRLQDDVRA